jgi:HD-GYP domain-containing protein (c-di-GMP phosphodiesterase class II)
MPMTETERIAIADSIRRALNGIESHNPSRRGHSERVAVYAVAVGERLGMTDEQLVSLRVAAVLHDIGKLKVATSILESSQASRPEDLVTIRQHVCGAGQGLDQTLSIEGVGEIIASQYERVDGLGFPGRLRADSIPLGSRILHAAVAFDVLSTEQPWRTADPDPIGALKRASGTQFDESVVESLDAVRTLIQPIRTDCLALDR